MEKNRGNKTYRKTKNRKAYVKKNNYEKYYFSYLEFIVVLVKGIVVLGIIAYLFYDSWYALLFLSPFLFVYFRLESSRYREKRIERLREEFKESLIHIGECMEAGYSVENSFVESYLSMRERYGDSSDMVQELNLIKQSLKLNVKIEDLLFDFAVRSENEDVRDFVIVFSQAKRGGGNMAAILKRTIGMIKEKIELQKEIQLLISGKKYEQRIMSLVPLGVMVYMRITSEGFFDVLYHNGLGIVIMSVCLLVYGVAIAMGERITKIEV